MAVFAAPWLAAWWVYHYQPDLVARGGAAAGELIDSPVPMASWLPAGDDGHRPWTILQIEPDNCGVTCRDRLASTRQVRALMHRKAADVRRLLLLPDGPLDRPALQPDDLIVRRNTQRLRHLLSDVGGIDGSRVYLVDPKGLIILAYPDFQHGERLRQDLTRLLSLGAASD